MKDYYKLISKLPGVISVTIESNYVEHVNPYSMMPEIYRSLPYFDITVNTIRGTLRREHIPTDQINNVYNDIKLILKL